MRAFVQGLAVSWFDPSDEVPGKAKGCWLWTCCLVSSQCGRGRGRRGQVVCSPWLMNLPGLGIGQFGLARGKESCRVVVGCVQDYRRSRRVLHSIVVRP